MVDFFTVNDRMVGERVDLGDGRSAFIQSVQTVDSAGVAATGLTANDLRSPTATFTSVASGTTSATILAANAVRKGATIVNTDANTLYLDLSGGTASATRYSYALATGGTCEVPFGYSGAVTGVWAADGAGAALVTEFA